MTGNTYNFNLNGGSNSDFNNKIDTSNLVDGRPIYYIKNASNAIYDSSINAGTFYCICCVNVTIKDMNLNKNGVGIFLRNTTRSRIQNITALNNGEGIVLFFSSNNTIYNNYFSNANNSFDNGNNIWNTPKTPGTNIINGAFLGGNFWGDYAGKDIDGDGLGDTMLPYTSSGKIVNGGDYLPLAYKPAATTGIIVTSPNGAENWTRGTIQTIRWNYTGIPETNVKIELLKNGVVNRTILASTPNDKSQNWTILSTQAPGVDYRIRITSTTNVAYNDTSNSNFTIGV